jgi:hypothetical protein
MSNERIIAKLIKLESFQVVQDFLEVKKGDLMNGYFTTWPQVGESFTFVINKKVNTEAIGGFDLEFSMPPGLGYPIYTSEVIEILDGRTFKTRNSIYKIVTLEDERDNKIKIIFE